MVVLFAAGHNPVIHASWPSWVSLFIYLLVRMVGSGSLFLSSTTNGRTVLSFIYFVSNSCLVDPLMPQCWSHLSSQWLLPIW
jgi:hypothetical protein